MIINHQLFIQAPLEAVFNMVSDWEKIPLWMEGVVEIVPLGDPTTTGLVGQKFTQRVKEGGRITEYTGEITAYEALRHLGLKVGGAMFTFDLDFRFSPEGSGTRLDYSAGTTFHNLFAKVMGTLFSWLTRRIVTKQLAKLKQIAEAEAIAG